ncbi:Replication termination factor 2 [Gracilaria domingensis]|nr:Replication termination factor 2 [Gracilaria domingensis]
MRALGIVGDAARRCGVGRATGHCPADRPQQWPPRRRRRADIQMGGDGGTLNNSRHEHTRLRATVLGAPTLTTQHRLKRQRASVTHCELSKQPLSPPHIVVDRLGLLYNKDALINYILHRAREKTAQNDALSHIVRLKRDTARVRFVSEDGVFVCPVTKRVVSEGGRFTIGWQCGCVTATIEEAVHHEGTSEQHSTLSGDMQTCVACSETGERIPLGLSVEERQKRLRSLLEVRKRQREQKKKKRAAVSDADPSPPKRAKHSEIEPQPA